MWLGPNEPVADIALSPWQIRSIAWRWRPWIISELGSAAIVLSLLYCDTVHVSPNHAAVAFEPSHIHIEHKYKSCSLPHPEPLYDMKNHGVATCSRVFATDGMGQQEIGDRENFQVTSSWKLQTCRRVMGKRVGKNWMPAFSRSNDATSRMFGPLKMLAAILILESSSPWGHTEQGPTHLWSPNSEEDHEGRIVRRFQPLQNLQIGQLMEYQWNVKDFCLG